MHDHATPTVLVGLLATCFALPMAVHAQQWTPAQKEVWNRVTECTGYFADQNFDAMADCVHDNFVGWQYGQPIPRTKSAFMTIGRYMIDNVKVVAHDLRPLNILVLDDVAVVHYMGFSVIDGSLNVEQDRWTDILVKEEGQWYWIADHGGSVSSRN